MDDTVVLMDDAEIVHAGLKMLAELIRRARASRLRESGSIPSPARGDETAALPAKVKSDGEESRR